LDLTRPTIVPTPSISSRRIRGRSPVYPVSFHRGQPAGREMKLYGTRPEKFLLVGLALSMATVGVLTTLVINQEHDPNTVADTPAGPALTPPAPQLAPAPPVTAPPALVAPAPRIMSPTQLAPPSPKPLKATTLPRRRANQVPAPAPVVAPPPTAPARPVKPGSPEGWDPIPPARSDSAVKPGSPDGS
jgi:hypothetical protein